MGLLTGQGFGKLWMLACTGEPLTYKQDEADLDESGWRSDPQPVCEEHDLRILECLDCCSLIFAQADYMRIDDRHSWAMTHVYKAKEAW
jgi:hypothetical protein